MRLRTFKNSDKVNFKNGRTPFVVGIANFLTATLYAITLI